MTDKNYGPWIPVQGGPPEGVTTEEGEKWQVESRNVCGYLRVCPIQHARWWSGTTHIRLRADHPYYRHEWLLFCKAEGKFGCVRCQEKSSSLLPEFGCVPRVHSEPVKKTTAEVDSSEILEDPIHTDEGPSRPVSRVVRYKTVRPSVDDPWTEWDGGECPIKDPDAVVEVKYPGGGVELNCCRSVEWRWSYLSNRVGIIAYRVLRSSCPEDYEIPKKPVVRVEWSGRYEDCTLWRTSYPSAGVTFDYFLRTELHDGKPVSVQLMTREEVMQEVGK